MKKNLYEILLKGEYLFILVEAETEAEALKIFKGQTLYVKGVTKADYTARLRG